jgi:hypothetical protein
VGVAVVVGVRVEVWVSVGVPLAEAVRVAL